MNKTELREKSLKIAHEARAILDTIKDDNSNANEVQTQFDSMMKESDGYAERADRMEAVENRTSAFNEIITEVTDTSSEVRKTDGSEEKRAAAFDAYLRGKKDIGELRAMGITGQEGVITPTTFTTALLDAPTERRPDAGPVAGEHAGDFHRQRHRVPDFQR